jgi:signal transduction histidine kinase
MSLPSLYRLRLAHVFGGLLGCIAAVRGANHIQVINSLQDAAINHQPSAVTGIQRVLSAQLPYTTSDRGVQSQLASEAISGMAETSRIVVKLGDETIADNAANVKYAIPDAVMADLLSTSVKYSADGEQRTFGEWYARRDYSVISRAVLVSGRQQGRPTMDVFLVQDITANTEAIRHTAATWAIALIAVCAGGFMIVWRLAVAPLQRIGEGVLNSTPIASKWWYPVEIGQLSVVLEKFRVDALAYQAQAQEKREIAERLAEQIQTVNHISMHDVKADLTALNMGSEVIQDTVTELTAYTRTAADPVVRDALETLSYFAGLNINSARNAFDVLDQRNKLFDLENTIDLGNCSIADIFDALTAAFVGEPGELILLNECPANRAVIADYSLLLTVLKNIVRNGFTHNDSPFKVVSIRVGPVGNRSHITITDNGVGMPESYLADWGKTMGKAAQLSTDKGGSGTGLYSIKNIIDAHKTASVAVTSVLGKGSTFTLEFDHVK